jgi:hypothetical protein
MTSQKLICPNVKAECFVKQCPHSTPHDEIPNLCKQEGGCEEFIDAYPCILYLDWKENNSRIAFLQGVNRS